MINYYTVLGVQNFAPYEDIKTAYRKLSKQWHPDLNGGSAYHAEKFKEIQAAYECLSKPDKREFYDYKLKNFLTGYESQKTTADPHYSYTSYQQPVYEKERTTEWFTPRMFLRVAYMTFIAFRMYTCNSGNSSTDFYRANQDIPVTYDYNKTAQEILDSFAKAGQKKDSSNLVNLDSVINSSQFNK